MSYDEGVRATMDLWLAVDNAKNQEMKKVVRGLKVAMSIADAVPTEAHKHEGDLKWFGEVMNVHGGYDAIRDGLEAARAVTNLDTSNKKPLDFDQVNNILFGVNIDDYPTYEDFKYAIYKKLFEKTKYL